MGFMKPMFPILFPWPLPMIPKVMDNLMPHMIGDLVPLVTDPDPVSTSIRHTGFHRNDMERMLCQYVIPA